MTQRCVLITGASRGIGAATAKLFAQHGYRVAINFKSNLEAAEQTLAQLPNPEQHLLLQADVSDEKACAEMFRQLDDVFGRLDVLVNNAGVLFEQKPLVELQANRIEQVFKTNVLSHFLCSKQAVLRMSTEFGGNGGSIVNVSSGAAITGSPNEYVDYAASKGAIDTLTNGLAKEVANFGIRVNGVRPGFIYTDMHADGGEPDRVDRLKSKIPLKRGGTAEEVAQSIWFLASEKASYTTGSMLDVCGGAI